MATLAELASIYSLEDAYNMLEIVLVDSYNRRLAEKANNG